LGLSRVLGKRLFPSLVLATVLGTDFDPVFWKDFYTGTYFPVGFSLRYLDGQSFGYGVGLSLGSWKNFSLVFLEGYLLGFSKQGSLSESAQILGMIFIWALDSWKDIMGISAHTPNS
jgi:hypothetical protein